MTEMLPESKIGLIKTQSAPEGNVAAPTIAVVIVGRNSAKFLSQMLDSLIDQTDLPEEIIYYDDYSLDSSQEILKCYESTTPNFKVIYGARQIGISAARNIANSHVKSDYIAVLDSDDLFLSDTVNLYRQCLNANPGIDMIYADTVVFQDGTGLSWRMRYPGFIRSPRAIWRLMTSPIVPFKHSSLIYRREAIEALGGYSEDLPLKVDFDLFVRFINSDAVIKKLDCATSHHRTHAGQISKERLKGILLYWRIIDFHEARFVRSSLYKIIRTFGEIAKFALGR